LARFLTRPGQLLDNYLFRQSSTCEVLNKKTAAHANCNDHFSKLQSSFLTARAAIIKTLENTRRFIIFKMA